MPVLGYEFHTDHLTVTYNLISERLHAKDIGAILTLELSQMNTMLGLLYMMLCLTVTINQRCTKQ